MKIAVAGTGYVGLVTGVCLASKGHNVTCVDVDERKLNMLENGQVPIYEPELEELLQENRQNRCRGHFYWCGNTGEERRISESDICV